MTPPLFLLDPLPEGEEVLLVGEEGRHAARVKRLGRGERALVGDGHGTVLDCVVTDVLPDGLRLQVTGRHVEPEPRPRLVVVQALPKGERGELAVELMTELGVDEILAWSAARSISHWRDARAEKGRAKWQRTAQEAAKQSRREWVPVVSGPVTTRQACERVGAAATALVLHEDARETLASCPLAAGGEIVIVVGPEGGVADDELEQFAAAGAVAVRMGKPVLRTSTAGTAALAALSLRLGRWN